MRELHETPAKNHQEIGWEEFFVCTADDEVAAHGSIYVTFEVIGIQDNIEIQISKQAVLDQIRQWISKGTLKVSHTSGDALKIIENL